MLNFCQMNSVFGGYFLGFCFSENIFLVFCQWQSIFWVVQKYPAPLIPVCMFIKYTPMGVIVAYSVQQYFETKFKDKETK